ncbi:MAG TPA: DUF4149 domain-containing protein [Burkholderiaceae bacterium]|nr:DUF4149 domain-containing protein [Burkholderiaceae bacterium]
MSPLRLRLSILVAALWWGGSGTLAFVAVPTLFAHFGNPSVAGPAAAKLFTAIAWLVVVCGVVLLLLGRDDRRGPVGRGLPFILLAMLCMLVQEYGVSYKILTARSTGASLALWHGVGSALILTQWLCATRVLWLLGSRSDR